MAQPPVQRLDDRIFDALGIVSRGPYGARLGEIVHPVVSIPLGIGSESALGFNDAETDGDAAFAASGSVAGVAAQLTHTQVLNPTGSGRIVYIDAVYAWAGAAEQFLIDWYDTPCTNLVMAFANRRRGGGASALQLRSQNSVAALYGATPFARMITSGANIPEELIFDPPLKLAAGEGVVMGSGIVNLTHVVSWRARAYIA